MQMVGFDPGLSGAVACLTDSTTIRAGTMLPTWKPKYKQLIDASELKAWLDRTLDPAAPFLFVLEAVSPHAKQGLASSFAFGRDRSRCRHLRGSDGLAGPYPMEAGARAHYGQAGCCSPRNGDLRARDCRTAVHAQEASWDRGSGANRTLPIPAALRRDLITGAAWLAALAQIRNVAHWGKGPHTARHSPPRPRQEMPLAGAKEAARRD